MYKKKTLVCVHYIYLINKFHNLSWITEISELFHDFLIYWDAPVYSSPCFNEKFPLGSAGPQTARAPAFGCFIF